MHFQLIQLLTGVSMSRLTSRRVSPSHDLYRVALRCVVSVAFIIAPSLTAQTSLPATSAPTTGAQPTIAPADWNGGWIGVVTTASVTPAGQTPINLPVHLVISGAPNTPTIEITAALAGAIAAPAREASLKDHTIGFLLSSSGRNARFDGKLSDDGSTVTGSFGFTDEEGKSIPPTLPWTMRRVDLVSSVASAKTYNMTLGAMGQKIAMTLALGEGPHGWCGAIDILAQGIRNFPLEVSKDGDTIVAVMQVAPPGSFRLKPSTQAGVLEGTYTQASFTEPVLLTEVAGGRLASARRPQDPVPPFPYTDREVMVTHMFGHKLSGTLSLPTNNTLARDGKFPAIVLVSGSGPQDRDESILGHRPFAVISDALARAGVAVLRYDDRGTGGSTGDFAACTTADFATDADMCTEWLKKQPEIDAARIGMLGHSEGAMIAPLVAQWQNVGDVPINPLAFVVLLAPPIEPCGSVLNRQTQLLYDASGTKREVSDPAVLAHGQVMRAVMDKASAQELRPLVEDLVRAQLAAAGQVAANDADLKTMFDGAMEQLTSKWMTFFIRFDPRSAIVANEVPMLAMFGSKDVQVEAASNQSLLVALTIPSKRPATVRVYEGLNHLFQPATTGLPNEYGSIETTFDPKALADLVAWVVVEAGRAPMPQIPEASRPTINFGGAPAAAPASGGGGLVPSSTPRPSPAEAAPLTVPGATS